MRILNKKIVALSIGTIALLSLSSWHDYHVTITEVNYSSVERTLVVAHKIFIDDLERALSEQGVQKLTIDLENQKEDAVNSAVEFIGEHFEVKVNDAVVVPHYSGLEWVDHHALWFYFQANDVEEAKKIEINNDLFTELFEAQENLHYIYFNKSKHDLLLNKDRTSGIVFKDDH